MKNIAIFVSGDGAATERIVKLFNEGNRLKTVVIFADDSAADIASRLEKEDVEVVHFPDSEWLARSREVADKLKDKEVNLLVLDGFRLALSDEVMETTEGEMIRVTTPEQAPREVVAALEAELRKPQDVVEKEEVIEAEEKEKDSSPESEWAEALNIRFTPPKVPSTPPEIPGAGSKETEQEDSYGGSLNGSSYPKFNDSNLKNSDGNSYPKFNPERYANGFSEGAKRDENEQPMPSTWLVWSVLVTIFCCFIPGIVAIIFSSQVSTRYYAGDIEGSRRASKLAEAWIIVSFVLGVISATLYLPFMLMSN